MPKTSIYLSEQDKSYCLTKGKNLSEGIRFCIAQERSRVAFMSALRQTIKELNLTSPQGAQAVTDDMRTKILGLMED
jgi:hypothetical protein